MINNKELTEDALIIVSSFNEEKNINEVINELQKYFKHILVVNDGSNDDSQKILDSMKNIMCLFHCINLGQGAAIETGLKYFIDCPQYSYAITFDGDGQHKPEQAFCMLEIAKRQNINAVLGTRFGDMNLSREIPLLKRITLHLASLYERIFFNIRLSDAHNGLRVLSKKIVKDYILPIKSSSMGHGTELSSKIVKSGLNYIEYNIEILYKGKRTQSAFNAINIIFSNLLGY